MSAPIPSPRGIPLLGNINDVDPQNSVLSLTHLAEKHADSVKLGSTGEIFKLSILGKERFIVSSVALLDDVLDETRFCKNVFGGLEQLRKGIGDGLFTAYHGEHNWEVAHRALAPAFSPLNTTAMYDEMYDIASQLVAKWARMGPEESIDVTGDFTRLALDSIALCAMGTRFNSFYRESMHPFIDAMVGFLSEGAARAARTRLGAWMNPAADRKFQADIDVMRTIAADVIKQRRANPTDKKDLLNGLLYGKDPKTGEGLTDESIMNNMLTFLIAGHETTSGLLSFTWYYLLKNPDALQKAQEEVDRVVGKGPITAAHMTKLPYIEATLRESLRLSPSAPLISVRALDTMPGPVLIGGGKYLIPKGSNIACILSVAGRDPDVYGPDANEYKPERMYGENFRKLPPNAWKPFGNGSRGCIGRPFAWQEATMTMALILQNFNIRFDDSSYSLRIKQTLTVKPDGFHMKARLRDGIDPIMLERKMFGPAVNGTKEVQLPQAKKAVLNLNQQSQKQMTILYGSNSGTCEGLAQNLASNAGIHGFSASVRTLDASVENLPTDQPIVIFAASYEGNPADNAANFVSWLQKSGSSRFKNVRYAVFGCGHHDWVATYQKIPTLIDTELAAKGATPITKRGECDVGEGQVLDTFDSWQDECLWPQLSQNQAESSAEGLDMEINTNSRASHLRHALQDALVIKNEMLTSVGMRKRHVEFRLPTTLTYEAGDYLAILPANNMKTISRVLRKFGLPWDAMMKLAKGAHTTIPTETELAVTVVLGAYVELNTPASKKNISTIAQFAPEADREKVLGTTTGSVLDILEAHPSIKLPFAVYLSMLPPMRIRQYSISSSPLVDPTVASITFGVIDGQHLGVATNHLESLEPGATVHLAIKKSHAAFHLPLEPTTPVLMLCAGTGLAPFYGFVQERAARIANGQKNLGGAVLIVGCQSPEDRLYAEQFQAWEAAGVVKVLYAFSRASDKSQGCKYAQDRLWYDRELISTMFANGARAYICGSARLGKGVNEVATKMRQEYCLQQGQELTQEECEKWWDGLRGERYALDVFD